MYSSSYRNYTTTSGKKRIIIVEYIYYTLDSSIVQYDIIYFTNRSSYLLNKSVESQCLDIY